VAEVDTRIEVTGLAEALKTLQKVDPELRKEVIKGMKVAASPLEAAARSLVPDARPLTNWYGWRGGWNTTTVRKGIKVAFRGGRVKGQDRDVFPLLTLRQTNAAGVIYDIAGRSSAGTGSGVPMIQKLNETAHPSRSMWPAAERNMPAVTEALETIIGTVSNRISKELG
jgi:hypothetical protein